MYYAHFYKQRGVRLATQLNAPPITSILDLSLPKSSVFHHLDQLEPLTPNHIMFKNDPPQRVWVKHIEKLDDYAHLGDPTTKVLKLEKELQEYFTEYKSFKRLRKEDAFVSNDRHLLVYNYNLIDKAYRYVKPKLREYNKWRNFMTTVIKNVIRCADETRRNQFLIVDVPTVIPGVASLKLAEGEMTTALAKRLPREQDWMVVEFWKWLSGDTSTGIWSLIPDKYLNKIDIIFRVGGNYTVVNLGVLYGFGHFFKGSTVKPKFKPIQLAKRFLLLLVHLNLHRTGVIDKSDTDFSDSESVEEEDDLLSPGSELDDENIESIETPEEESLLEPDDPTEQIDVTSEESDKQIDEILDTLDIVHEDSVVYTDDEISEYYQDYTPTEVGDDGVILEQAKLYASRGRISGTELKRFEKLSKKYETIDNPFGEGKLSDMLNISQEELAISESTPIASGVTGVIDETMKSNSLMKFDTQYINKILPKDMSKSVMTLQKAGIAVQDYKVEAQADITGEFEVHKVKVVPVIGTPSTLEFRVPIVDKDGNFTIGGVKRKLRKQRGDLPIRKISPSEVALTSYYSKLFVRRSERVKFNFSIWLPKQIISRSIDKDDKSVEELKLGDVFDHEESVPRHYSTIARQISSFNTGDYRLKFNINKLEEYFPGVERTDELLPLGYHKKHVCYMDNDNQVLVYNESTRQFDRKGTILDIIDSNTDFSRENTVSLKSKIPVEMAELMLFGKPLPVGVVLGYYIGLGNLLKTFKIAHFKEKASSRTKATENSMVIRFKDFRLVIVNPNTMTQLLLAGFIRYEKAIKRYSLLDFDKPDVYGSIFEVNGVTPRYVREFDTMRDLWIDPITKDILVEMEEPIDFVLLLNRAVELLLTDDHPHVMDSNYMRDKGYERIAGIVYGEMIKSIRQYQSRPKSKNISVSMNPEAVWYKIMQDQSAKTVDEANPIQALKEAETVVYRGSGGRSARSMTAKSRKYHKSNKGVISEGLVDNSDVGTVIFLSGDPNYTSVRGRMKTMDGETPAKLQSTSMMISPFADRD